MKPPAKRTGRLKVHEERAAVKALLLANPQGLTGAEISERLGMSSARVTYELRALGAYPCDTEPSKAQNRHRYRYTLRRRRRSALNLEC